MRKGKAHARRDAGDSHTVVHRSLYGLVLEQRIAPLRHAREEAGVGVETGIKMESRGIAKSPREAGLERGVLVVVHTETGAT